MPQTLTPAQAVLFTLQLLMDETELDMDRLGELAGIPIERLFNPQGMIASADVVNILGGVRKLVSDPAVCLHIGEEIGIEILDMVGMMLSTAPTARAAILAFQRYMPLVSTLVSIDLVEEGDAAHIVLRQSDELAPIHQEIAESAGAAFWNISRRLVQGEVRLRRISLSYPPPSWADEYPRVFGEEVEILFNAAEDVFSFDRAMLDLPMVKHTPGLFQRLQQQAALRLAALPQVETASASVLRLVRKHLGERLLDLPTVAGYMGLTPRTLQRRLKDEDTSFQTLYDSCRQQLARVELLDRNTDAETLSRMLGYSEPSAFYRAFRTWFGCSPSTFRQQHEKR
jgi:AraC-like DNA-binding protein